MTQYFQGVPSNDVDKSLKNLVYRQMPFGPPHSEIIDDPRAAARLFDWHNHAFANLLKGSHLIIGRRGAGKSALVRSYHAVKFLNIETKSNESRDFIQEYNLTSEQFSSRPDIIVDVDTFREIYNFEVRYKVSGVIPPPEVVTPAWERRIWLLVARQIERSRPGILPDAVRNLAYMFEDIEPNLTYEEMVSYIESTMDKHKLKCVVIFDSGDNYGHEELQTRVFEGLCRAASNMIGRRRGIDVRLCLPAEILDELEPHFSNPGKDFFRKQYLHWNAEELFRIAAYRLRTYLRLYVPNEHKLVQDIQFRNRESLWSFWERYLPQQITNDLRNKENTIVYILRHTHLLPRQLIQILNEIWGSDLNRSSEVLFSSPVDQDNIKKAVKIAEIPNKDSILSMYSHIYKDIYRIFEEVMPLLSRSFEFGHLHHAFNQSGAQGLMAGAHCPNPEFWHFRRLMFSTGAIGVVESETDVYIQGRFQFNQKYPLTANEQSTICVHPMFSRVYQLKTSRSKLAVLPRGSDFRENFNE